MDAKAARRSLSDAYGQAVWSWRPDAGVKLVDGSHGRRWLTRPAHRGEHGAAVKTIAQGVPVVRLPCVACVRKVQFVQHARLAGAASIRHSLRPLRFKRVMSKQKPGAIAPRRREAVSEMLWIHRVSKRPADIRGLSRVAFRFPAD